MSDRKMRIVDGTLSQVASDCSKYAEQNELRTL